jgi:hypothetical protein
MYTVPHAKYITVCFIVNICFIFIYTSHSPISLGFLHPCRSIAEPSWGSEPWACLTVGNCTNNWASLHPNWATRQLIWAYPDLVRLKLMILPLKIIFKNLVGFLSLDLLRWRWWRMGEWCVRKPYTAESRCSREGETSSTPYSRRSVTVGAMLYCRSVTFLCGSGSADQCLWPSRRNKKHFFSKFFCLLLFEGTIKGPKEVTKQ